VEVYYGRGVTFSPSPAVESFDIPRSGCFLRLSRSVDIVSAKISDSHESYEGQSFDRIAYGDARKWPRAIGGPSGC